jgi:hypothetical protein
MRSHEIIILDSTSSSAPHTFKVYKTTIVSIDRRNLSSEMPSMTGTSTGSPAPTATHVERSIDPTLFAGKVFHIAPGLFKEYEDKLKADIKVSLKHYQDRLVTVVWSF